VYCTDATTTACAASSAMITNVSASAAVIASTTSSAISSPEVGVCQKNGSGIVSNAHDVMAV